MKTYYGNYLGVVISGGEKDPEGRGRCQVFIPHIMPALYEGWNKESKDINFDIIGNTIPTALSPKIVEKLQKMLPWAECAAPIVGSSPSVKNSSEQIRNSGGTSTKEGFSISDLELGGSPGDNAAYSSLTDVASQQSFASGKCGTAVGEILESVYGYSEEQIREASPDGRRDGKNYDTILRNLGWTPIQISSPSAAPPNSILSYGAVPGNRWGHVEWVGINPNGDKAYYFGLGGANGVSTPGGGSRVGERNVGGFGGIAWVPPGNLSNAKVVPANFANSPYAKLNGQLGINPSIVTGNVGINMAQPGNEQLSFAGGTPGASGSSGLNSLINPNDVKPSGSSQTRNVSVYGSIYNDFTTFLDVKPEQRPPEAIAYWTNQGYNIPAQEQRLRERLPGWKPILDLPNTGQGKFLAGQGQGNLTPGFSVGIPSNNAYGLKPGGFIYITNQQGQPIGPNGGYFQVADAGNSQNLTKLNALDFYVGNDDGLNSYFKNLGGNLNIQPVDITGASADALKQALSQQANVALNGSTSTDTSGLASAVANQQIIQHPTSHPRNDGPDTNYQALGMFGYASEGTAVWVFFREGNPLFPVYFAASYGQREWQNMYSYASPGVGAGAGEGALPGTEKMRLNSYGGGFESVQVTDNPESGLEPNFTFQVYGKNGSNLLFTKDHTEFNSTFNHNQRVSGDFHEITEANKEERVRGDKNSYIEQDVYITIGNWSDEAIAASDEIQQYINEAMEIKSKTT